MTKVQKVEPRLHFGFKMPVALHKKLTALAKQERRSLTDEIIVLLEAGVKRAIKKAA